MAIPTTPGDIAGAILTTSSAALHQREWGHTGYLPARRLGLACAAPPGTTITDRSKDPVSLHGGTTRTEGVSSAGTRPKEMETGHFSTAILGLREGCFRMP